MPEIAVRVFALALSFTFAWSALGKVVRFDDWRKLLAGYRLPGPTEIATRFLVPASESAVVIAILAGNVRIGAAASLLLLAAFSIAILRARALQGDRLPCGCFGATKTRDYRFSLVRNAGLAVLAGALLVSGEDGSPLEGFAPPSGSETIAALLVLVGGALIAWMVWTVMRIGKHDPQAFRTEGVRK